MIVVFNLADIAPVQQEEHATDQLDPSDDSYQLDVDGTPPWAPCAGMEFPDWDQLMQHMLEYGARHRFRPVILHSHNDASGTRVDGNICCHRSGKYVKRGSSSTSRTTFTSKCECPFKVSRTRLHIAIHPPSLASLPHHLEPSAPPPAPLLRSASDPSEKYINVHGRKCYYYPSKMPSLQGYCCFNFQEHGKDR